MNMILFIWILEVLLQPKLTDENFNISYLKLNEYIIAYID